MNISDSGNVSVRVTFAGVSVTDDIMPHLTGLSYTDSEGDETDDLQLELADPSAVWLRNWLGEMVNASSRTVASTVAGGATESTASSYRVTASSGLRVRSGAGTGYGVIGILSFGTSVTVESMADGWAKIRFNGQTAYCSAAYLQAAGSSVAQAVAQTEKVLGMRMQASIIRYGRDDAGLTQSVLDCGEFELDAVEAEGPPSTVVIKGTSLPYSSGLRKTKHAKVWENIRLSGIAAEMAKDAGAQLMKLTQHDPLFSTATQADETNAGFLQRLCAKYGVSVKYTANLIVLYDSASKEQKAPIVIRYDDKTMTHRRFSTGRAETEYQSCCVKYTDPKTGKLYSGTAYVDDYDADNEDNMQLEVWAKVGSSGEAKERAAFYLRRQNRYAKTVELTVPGDPELLGGVDVTLEGFGMWDGQYVIAKAVHEITRSGYITTVTLRRKTDGE